MQFAAVTVFNARAMAWSRLRGLLALALRSFPLILLHIFSIGLRSGEQAGRKRTLPRPVR